MSDERRVTNKQSHSPPVTRNPNLIQHLSSIIILLLLVLSACTPAPSPQPPTPTSLASLPTHTTTPIPQSTSPPALATLTPIPTLSSDSPPPSPQPLAPSPSPSPQPPAPISSPSPQPLAPTSPAPSPQPPAPSFLPDTLLRAPRDITITSDGTLWAISANGVHTYTQIDDTPIWSEPIPLDAQRFLPNDSLGRPWVLSVGPQASFYDPEKGWRTFTIADGWTMTRPDLWRPSLNTATLIDRRGDIWLADGRNGLHHYSEPNKQWETLSAADLGFPPPPPPGNIYDYHPTAITDTVQDQFGNIWISACHMRRYAAGREPDDPSRIYREGAGIRFFNGRTWDLNTELADLCVLDLAAAPDGSIWAVTSLPEPGSTGLFAYYFSDDGGQWLDLSPWAQAITFQGEALVADRLTVRDDAIYLTFQRRSFGEIWPSGVQMVQDGRWQTLLDGLDSPPYPLAIDQDNRVWGQSTGFLVHGDKNNTDILMPLEDWDIQKMVIDGDNQLWLYGRQTTDAPYDIWRYQPPD